MGFPNKNLQEIKGCIGYGARRTIERSLPAGTDSTSAKEAYCFFKEYYATYAGDRAKPYDGVIELLEDLKSQGVRIAVHSNSSQEAVDRLTTMFFDDYIDIALGESDKVRKKPDIVAISALVKELPCRGGIYVGDASIDADTAQNAGMPFILAEYGYGTQLELLHPMVVAHTAEDIRKILLSPKTHP